MWRLDLLLLCGASTWPEKTEPPHPRIVGKICLLTFSPPGKDTFAPAHLCGNTQFSFLHKLDEMWPACWTGSCVHWRLWCRWCCVVILHPSYQRGGRAQREGREEAAEWTAPCSAPSSKQWDTLCPQLPHILVLYLRLCSTVHTLSLRLYPCTAVRWKDAENRWRCSLQVSLLLCTHTPHQQPNEVCVRACVCFTHRSWPHVKKRLLTEDGFCISLPCKTEIQVGFELSFVLTYTHKYTKLTLKSQYVHKTYD